MRKQILDIPIDWVTHDELVRKIKLFMVSRKPHQITTVNAEFVVISRENHTFRRILEASDLSLADGTGIVLAQSLADINIASWLGRFFCYVGLGIKHILMPNSFSYQRITGMELSETVLKLAAEEGWKVYLLGAGPTIAEQAAKRWQYLYKGLDIVGATDDNPGDAQTVSNIKQAKPDILLVAYGAPKQELFIAEHADELNIPIMVGVGGTFDSAVGAKSRAPQAMKQKGLEWLVYLVRHPKRWRRIWRSTVTFSRIILGNK